MAPRAFALASIAAVLLAVPLEATKARAQGVQGERGGTVPVDGTVVLRLQGPDDPALRDAIRELLARLHLLVATSVPDADGGTSMQPVARVDIDLSSRTDALLVVTDDLGEIRFRHAVPRDASAAIVREEIAHAVQSAVESAVLAERERAARPSPAGPPPPSAPPTTAAAPPPSASTSPPITAPLPPAPSDASAKEQPALRAHSPPFGLELSTLAGVGPIANGAGPATRIGLGIAATSHGTLRPSLGFTFLYAVPFDSNASDGVGLSMHTTIASFRLAPAIELVHGKWLAVDLSAGGGIDLTAVAPHSNPDPAVAFVPTSDLKGQANRVDPILASMLTAHAALVPGVVFLLSAGVEVDLVSRAYVVDEGSAEVTVLAPWRVRPMVLAGFGFTALGDGHFSAGGGV
jgi:hypothetical protein